MNRMPSTTPGKNLWLNCLIYQRSCGDNCSGTSLHCTGNSYVCTFDTYHLPKYCFRSSTPLYDNCVPWFKWPLSAAYTSNTTHIVQEWFKSMMNSPRCCPGLQIPQISNQLSIHGMCWANQFNPRWLHLTTYSVRRICR